jgi:hypothetical protein
LPDAAKEWIVRYGPWITLVLLIFTLPALLVMLGIGTALMPFAGVGYATGFTYHTVILIAQLGLTVAALPGLFARKMSGWTLLFYAQWLSLLFSVLGGSIIGAAIGLVIGLYILFQVRPLYTN